MSKTVLDWGILVFCLLTATYFALRAFTWQWENDVFCTNGLRNAEEGENDE
jgi:hypothetical protein